MNAGDAGRDDFGYLGKKCVPWTYCDAGEKAIEVRQPHPVVRGMIRHEVIVKRIEVDRAVQREAVFIVPSLPVAEAA